MSWNREDYLRNETESDNYERVLGEYLQHTDYTDWFELRQSDLYSPEIARSLELALMSAHEDRRERARMALRQLAALAEEAREQVRQENKQMRAAYHAVLRGGAS